MIGTSWQTDRQRLDRYRDRRRRPLRLHTLRVPTVKVPWFMIVFVVFVGWVERRESVEKTLTLNQRRSEEQIVCKKFMSRVMGVRRRREEDPVCAHGVGSDCLDNKSDTSILFFL